MKNWQDPHRIGVFYGRKFFHKDWVYCCQILQFTTEFVKNILDGSYYKINYFKITSFFSEKNENTNLKRHANHKLSCKWFVEEFGCLIKKKNHIKNQNSLEYVTAAWDPNGSSKNQRSKKKPGSHRTLFKTNCYSYAWNARLAWATIYLVYAKL